MLFIGLTGGIGAGKSEALAASERLGAAVLSTDVVVHELLGSDQLKDTLSERWGERVLTETGEVDRATVAEIVFESPEELRWLESVLFPGSASALSPGGRASKPPPIHPMWQWWRCHCCSRPVSKVSSTQRLRW